MSTKPSTAPAGTNLVSYVIGFVTSILLTLAAYHLVTGNTYQGWALFIGIAALAIAQLLVQLVFFLHLSREDKPRWNLSVFVFTVMVVGILLSGSLWIMYNLNYHHMTPKTPAEVNTYLRSQDGL